MGSTLTVDNIVGATTAANVKLPAGSILQVVTTKQFAASITTTSSSYVTTGLAVTITPKFATSNIYLSLQGGGHYLPIYSQFAYITIYKGSTDLSNSARGFESVYHTQASNAADTNYGINPHSLAHIDAAGSTSALTYTIYMKCTGGTYQFQETDRADILFTAMEVSV